MNKFVAKTAQAGLLAMVGYEIGEKVGEAKHDEIVVKVKETEVHSTNNADNGQLTTISYVILALLLIIVISRLCAVFNKKVRATEIIPMSERQPQGPRI